MLVAAAAVAAAAADLQLSASARLLASAQRPSLLEDHNTVRLVAVAARAPTAVATPRVEVAPFPTLLFSFLHLKAAWESIRAPSAVQLQAATLFPITAMPFPITAARDALLEVLLLFETKWLRMRSDVRRRPPRSPRRRPRKAACLVPRDPHPLESLAGQLLEALAPGILSYSSQTVASQLVLPPAT